MPLVCDKLSIRLKEQGLRKYDLRKDKIMACLHWENCVKMRDI